MDNALDAHPLVQFKKGDRVIYKRLRGTVVGIIVNDRDGLLVLVTFDKHPEVEGAPFNQRELGEVCLIERIGELDG